MLNAENVFLMPFCYRPFSHTPFFATYVSPIHLQHVSPIHLQHCPRQVFFTCSIIPRYLIYCWNIGFAATTFIIGAEVRDCSWERWRLILDQWTALLICIVVVIYSSEVKQKRVVKNVTKTWKKEGIALRCKHAAGFPCNGSLEGKEWENRSVIDTIWHLIPWLYFGH